MTRKTTRRKFLASTAAVAGSIVGVTALTITKAVHLNRLHR
ncbi:MAG: hypothetical protein RML39_08350 [Oscillatoriaceae cyanobacterium SKYGB_i_bin93]|nr:hypothetical protein [Oscillatoriaceae cyanobacterium SKYGB_i_bin93]